MPQCLAIKSEPSNYRANVPQLLEGTVRIMRKFEPPDRALIDLRDQRDHLNIQLSLLSENRLAPADELSRLKLAIQVLERRIVEHERRPAPS